MTEGHTTMLGRLLCSLGLHRVVTTREGKTSTPGSTGRGAPRTSGAATHIHAFCYRPGCTFHVIIDTHDGSKIDPAT